MREHLIGLRLPYFARGFLMQIILVKLEDNKLDYLLPSSEVLEIYTIEQVAQKDVVEGLPFWIIDNTELPEDQTFRDAWEISESMREPDGYGSPFNTFSEILENEIEDAEFEEVPDDNNQPE